MAEFLQRRQADLGLKVSILVQALMAGAKLQLNSTVFSLQWAASHCIAMLFVGGRSPHVVPSSFKMLSAVLSCLSSGNRERCSTGLPHPSTGKADDSVVSSLHSHVFSTSFQEKKHVHHDALASRQGFCELGKNFLQMHLCSQFQRLSTPQFLQLVIAAALLFPQFEAFDPNLV